MKSSRIHAPNFRRSLFACHEHAAVVADALGLIHSYEEPGSNGYVSGCDSFGFIVRQGEAREEEGDNGLLVGNIGPSRKLSLCLYSGARRGRTFAVANSQHDPGAHRTTRSSAQVASPRRHTASSYPQSVPEERLNSMHMFSTKYMVVDAS